MMREKAIVDLLRIDWRPARHSLVEWARRQHTVGAALRALYGACGKAVVQESVLFGEAAASSSAATGTIIAAPRHTRQLIVRQGNSYRLSWHNEVHDIFRIFDSTYLNAIRNVYIFRFQGSIGVIQ